MKTSSIIRFALLAVGGTFLSVACSSKPYPAAAHDVKPVAAVTPPAPTSVPAPATMAEMEPQPEAVKDYLVQLGIDAARIQIISYGKERPFVTGHDERAWAQNRRDHFLVTAG